MDRSDQPRTGDGLDLTTSLTWTATGEAVVAVGGELDVATAPQLAAVLEQAVATGRGQIVIELADLRFCGAAGVSVLGDAHGRLRRQGRALRLTDVSADIAQSFQLADAQWLLD